MMNNIVLVISCFEKAAEMDLFYHSLCSSDICDVPKITVVGTDPRYGLRGQDNLKIAQKYKSKHDRIFLCHRNIYNASFRYVVDIIGGQCEYLIATEADIWFNKHLIFQKHITYLEQTPTVATINTLTSPVTPELMDKMNYVYFSEHPYTVVDGYLNLTTNVPWHLVLTRVEYIEQFYTDTGHEIEDYSYTEFCRQRLNKLVLTTDDRADAKHLDRVATLQKYPALSELYNHRFRQKIRRIRPRDITEIR